VRSRKKTTKTKPKKVRWESDERRRAGKRARDRDEKAAAAPRRKEKKTTRRGRASSPSRTARGSFPSRRRWGSLPTPTSKNRRPRIREMAPPTDRRSPPTDSPLPVCQVIRDPFTPCWRPCTECRGRFHFSPATTRRLQGMAGSPCRR